MKIFANIPNGFKLFRSVSVFNKKLPEIEAARQAGDFELERERIHKATDIWVNNVIKMFDMTVNITGQENIPMDKPCVFMANHQGYGDIPVMLKVAEGKQIGFVAKDTLQKLPYFGKWIYQIRGVFLKRGDAREALKSISEGVKYLKDGFSLVIFPEGTRSHGPGMRPFKAGSFKLATRAKVPIVPVTINGTHHLFEDRDIITKGATIDIVVHEPIDTASLDRHSIATLPETVENTIRTQLEEMNGKGSSIMDISPEEASAGEF